MRDFSYRPLWAKTPKRDDGSSWHPLACHLLDVAAVAERLVDSNRFLAEVAERWEIDPATLRRVVVLLVALHDIGKASGGFQQKSEQQWPRVRVAFAIDETADNMVLERDHMRATAWYLQHPPGGAVLNRLFPDLNIGEISTIAAAVAGHHGQPAKPGNLSRAKVGEPFQQAGFTLIEDLRVLIAPGDQVIGYSNDQTLAALSWGLSALLPVADWLGSNKTLFPFHNTELSLKDYWNDIARPRARKAMAQSDLLPAPIAPAGAARTLADIARLSPMQRWAETVELPDRGPVLVFIEDATGAGKTEATFLILHRLMEKGLANGSYVALPTMATANAMYDRLQAVYRRFCVDGAEPMLILAHGKAEAHNAFVSGLDSSRADTATTDDVSDDVRHWLTDDRRKALLAQFGAGTIDQALLAVLSARYQSLRLYGLADKVLFGDEIHCYDSYVGRELENLITFAAMLGGSVILLSATLPVSTRQKLCDAFAKGSVWRTGDTSNTGGHGPVLGASAYPLATIVSGGQAREQPLAMRDGTERNVRVARIGTLEEAERLALEEARTGAAVAVIRSTVAEVQKSYDRLLEAADGNVPVDLFHARFMAEDRTAIEQACLTRFGKEGAAEARSGRILVASQVIEQSLDIDFDSMITDLAPVDLLIQRAGRLWRHEKRNDKRPLPEPTLHVISPLPADDSDKSWLNAVLPAPAFMYNAAILWLSADTLFKAKSIETRTLADLESASAGHVRALVEAVYGGAADERLPAGLRACFEQKLGEDAAARTIAEQQLLNPHTPYHAAAVKFEDEARVRTRMNEHTRPVWLALQCDDKMVPAARAPGGNQGLAWSFSEVSMTKTMLKRLQTAEDHGRQHFDPPVADFETGMTVLPMERDAQSGRLISICGRFAYDSTRGLEEIGEPSD